MVARNSLHFQDVCLARRDQAITDGEKEIYAELFRKDTDPDLSHSDAPRCPLMPVEQYSSSGRDRCDCPNVRVIALQRLMSEHECHADRPCPVRKYLLPHNK